ncbi:DUF4185 domain-containing protein [Mucilaginibacter gotjawali]|uniref:Uncharacterized protein n=2 Tax=Mucilaginibacter gotjawali TaxID=1550579 RepID=A0A839SG75_9SPHI|nr:DUF4185 domain-containing protein [Mucilaginibacter gotjawali]MBB3057295.1 hypothetical protein [Mucilaginibacter gotjawali]BAU52938.1 hypothetical protein MgSA37_01102 [Mucilaginibacter gotjawali]
MKKLSLIILSGVFVFCFTGVKGQAVSDKKTADLEHINFTVEPAPEWSGLLKRDSGWFGGDGIYTMRLNGVRGPAATPNDKILFLFSDSMIGEIRDHTMLPGYKMIHNSVAVLSGDKPVAQKMLFSWAKDTAGQAESIFVPHTPKTQNGDYYWLGDGFVNQELGNAIYIFGYRVRNVSDGAFGFKEVGNTLIKIPAGSVSPYLNQQQMDTPFFLTDSAGDSGSFGAGIYVNTKKAGALHPDGYIYVYGVRGMAKRLMIARVLPKDFEHFEKWTYWDGAKWVTEINKVADVTKDVSNELSLTALPDGRYALVFQLDGMTTTVGMRIGATPYGPFGPVIKLWDCKPDLLKNTYLVYNAKAHPSISNPGELLISYNINSTEFIKDLTTDPNLYRPRFIRVRFK